VIWPDGRKFGIDTVLDIRKAASHRAGGTGARYTCEICGKAVTFTMKREDGSWRVNEIKRIGDLTATAQYIIYFEYIGPSQTRDVV
jgi:hypothetical protein